MAKVPSCLLVTGLVGVMACFINVNGSTVRVSGSGRLDSLNYGIWLNPVKKKKSDHRQSPLYTVFNQIT